jgi:hypothetical protein
MPSIANQETIDTLAHNYCTSGFNKAKAMIDTGYKESYAMSGRGQAVYKNEQVKAAILVKMREIRNKSKDKIERIRELHEAGMALSLEKGDLVNYTRNVEGLGRTEAAYTDKVQDITDQQRQLTESEKSEAKRIAGIRLRETA